jgi:ParB/RepB/Spo0J family partition protein
MSSKKNLDLTGLRSMNNLRDIDAESKRDQVIMVHPDEVETPEQVRTVFNNIEELRATMDSDGQDSPISIGPKNERGKYPLLKGGRRHRAALIEPVMMLRAIIKVDAPSIEEHKAILSQVIENDQREDLLPHEIGRAYRAAQEKAKARGVKLTGRDIAKYTGRREEYISLHLSIADIPDSLTDLIVTKVTKDATVLASMRTLYDLNKPMYEAILVEAKEKQSLERSTVREALKRAKGGGETPPVAPAETPVAPVSTNASGNGAQKVAPPSGNGAALPETLRPNAEGESEDQGSANDENIAHAQTFGPAKAGQPGNGSAKEGTNKGASKKFVEIDPSHLMIFVHITFETYVKNGLLMTNRIHEEDRSKVWVSIVEDGGTPTPKLVNAEDVTIVSVNKRA